MNCSAISRPASTKATPAPSAGGRHFRSVPLRHWAALGILAFASCTANATEYTVLVLQSLTGGAAFIGVPAKDGIVLAAEEINRKQELGAGNSLKLVIADDATDRGQSLALITRYAADPKVLMVMGPTSGALSVGASNAAHDLKIPLLMNSNSLDVLKAGIWGNILTQPAANVVPFMNNYATDKLKLKNCSIIGLGDSDGYVMMQQAFESGAKTRGMKIGIVETIKGTDSDFSAIATKITASTDQDCVFISASAPQSANIVVQLRQAGLDPKVRIIGHTGLASPQFVERGGKAVEGVTLLGDWVPGGADDFGRAFATAYKAKYNTDPDNWAAIGYGGMLVAAAAIKAAGPNPTREAIRAALAKTKDVRVVVGQGRFSFDEQRVPRTGMNVLEVRNGKFVLAP
ncbi:ABC transporter substrate-binding protein [Polaromonas sp. P1-6]|nr:ABC transporter substrate-binding protein [Polaromonas sp. P1-6]